MEQTMVYTGNTGNLNKVEETPIIEKTEDGQLVLRKQIITEQTISIDMLNIQLQNIEFEITQHQKMIEKYQLQKSDIENLLKQVSEVE